MTQQQNNQNKYFYNGKVAANTSVAAFKRGKKITGIMSILSLGAFIYLTWLLVPAFFSAWVLIFPLYSLLVFTRSFGAWDAYLQVRKNSDLMAEELEELEDSILKADTNV